MPENNTMSTYFDISSTKISNPVEYKYPNRPNPAVQSQTDPKKDSVQADSFESQSFQVTISEEALRKAGLLKSDFRAKPVEEEKGSISQPDSSKLNTPEARALEELKRRDREVRAHEQAHVIAGGSLVRGSASFIYKTGSDGKLYAVSGEVSIDASAVQDDPSATIRKMMRVVTAALAPAQPSGQDRAVASAATETQMEAQQELTQKQVDKLPSGKEGLEQTKTTDALETKKSSAAEKKSDKDSKDTIGYSKPNRIPEPQNTAEAKHINIKA